MDGLANIARLKKTGEHKFNLWDSQGILTEDGLQASEEGIVHVPENGRIRLWVINHPIAGIVPFTQLKNQIYPAIMNQTIKTRQQNFVYKKYTKIIVSRLF